MTRFDRSVGIVSFRLSEKEYKDLRELCTVRGIRSISDLAWRAIQEWFAGDGAADQLLAMAIRELREKVQELDAEFKQLARRLPGLSSSCQSSGEVG
jgi:hypothetical protein